MSNTQHFPKNLWASVRAYHKWHSDKNVKLIRWVYNRMGVDALLVRFTNADGEDISSLMFCTEWNNSQWSVTEIEYSYRDDENTMIENYTNTPCDKNFRYPEED